MVIKIITGFVLSLAALFDLRTKQIPVITAVGLFVGNLMIRLFGSYEFLELISGLIPGAIALLISYLTKGKLGKGDGLMLLAVGIGFGAEQTFLMWWIALLLAAVVAIILLVCKKGKNDTELPFLPFLFCGFLICVIGGGTI